MAHQHGDGGASGAVYGTMAAGAIGGMLAIPVIVLYGLGLRLFLRHWRFTLPLSLAYALWFHPTETWDFIRFLPDTAWYTWHLDVAPTLGFVGDLLAELAWTWPGFVVLGLVALWAVGQAVEGFRDGWCRTGNWYDHI